MNNLLKKFIIENHHNINYLIELIKKNNTIDFIFLTKYINQYIINNYPNKPWDWGWLIYYTNICVEKYIPYSEFEKYKHKLNYWVLSKNPNLIEEFILRYPYKNWDIEYLIDNNKITDFKILSTFKNLYNYIIHIHPDKPWDWEWLIKNTDISVEKYISLDLIKKYKDMFDYCILSKNSNILEEFILMYPYQNWDIKYLINNNKITNFNALSKFKKINQYIIDEYPNKPWDWEWLIENTNIHVEEYISLDLIKKYKDMFDYCILSKNSNILEEFILMYPYQNWNIKYLIKNNKITDFKALSKFKKINQYIIDNYPDKLWDWEWLIKNTNIDVEKYIPSKLIKKYLDKWNYYYLRDNLNLTEEIILKYPYQDWDIRYLINNNKITNFNALSKFKNINQDIINKYSNKPWDWEWLIQNTNIHIEKYIPLSLIEKYLYKWYYLYLSKNPNITEEFILKYPYQYWDIKYLIKNNKITDFNALSKFININQYIINNYPDKPWDWEWLIKNTIIYVERYIPFNLIEKYLDKWNYWKLSKNQNITEDFILKYPNQNWNMCFLIKNNKITDFNALSKFRNIYEDIIDKYPNKQWDWEWLIENTDINVENYIPFNLIEKYLDKWDYYYLSKNPNLTEKIILKYPNQNWDIKYLIKNNKITDFNALTRFKYINKKIINKYLDKSWDWKWLIENTNIRVENYYHLSKNPNLTEEFILKYPYKDWDIEYLIKNNKITDFNALSKFKNITQDIIKKYSDKSWDWKWLIENTNIHVETYISLKLIEEYYYKLNYYILSENPNLTKEFILKHPSQNWNIEYLINNNKITDFNILSKFKNITQYIINKYPDKPWDWEWLIENTNIKLEKYILFNLIEKYLYKWNYYELSKNPNITEEFILKHPSQNWNIKYLINNNKITDFKSFSRFKKINHDIIHKYIDKSWDWEWIGENTCIDLTVIN